MAGQPSVNELVECVLRESRKESMVYKLAALRATGEILEATQTDRFTELSLIVFPIIKKVPNPPPPHILLAHTHMPHCHDGSLKKTIYKLVGATVVQW